MSWIAAVLREFRLRDPEANPYAVLLDCCHKASVKRSLFAECVEGFEALAGNLDGYNDFVNCKCDGQCWKCQNFAADVLEAEKRAIPIPEGSMRVAPGTDAVVWRVNPEYSGEL